MATNNPAMCRQTAGRRPTLLWHRVNFGLCRVQTRAKVNLAEPQTAIKNPQWGVSVRLTVSVKLRHNKPLKKMKWWSRQEQLQEKKKKEMFSCNICFFKSPVTCGRMISRLGSGGATACNDGLQVWFHRLPVPQTKDGIKGIFVIYSPSQLWI